MTGAETKKYLKAGLWIVEEGTDTGNGNGIKEVKSAQFRGDILLNVTFQNVTLVEDEDSNGYYLSREYMMSGNDFTSKRWEIAGCGFEE